MNFRNYTQLEDMVEALAGLNKSELETLAGCVFDILHGEKDNSVYTLCDTGDHSVCKKCGSVHVVKRGANPKGHQKYWCKDCGSIFTAVSDTVFSFTHKDADTWRDFILYTLEGRSLRFCAENCNISLSTSFMWRHKIMNAMKAQQFADSFTGLMELDEIFVNVSFKGNHKYSKTFTLPREPHKRGGDGRSRFPKDRACVLTVVNRDKGFSGIVTHRGLMNGDILSSYFDDRITDETIVMTDEGKALVKYFSNRKYEYISLPSSSEGSYSKTPPVVKGPYHTNNVNSLHSRFRWFLRKYNGVATKYLNSYVALFIWLENARKFNCATTDHLIEYLSVYGGGITYDEIRSTLLPAV